MPITIEFPPVQSTVGPGLEVHLRSDFIGPFPSDAQWHLAITLTPDFQQPFIFLTRPCTGNFTTYLVMADSQWNETRGGWVPTEQGEVNLIAQIQTQSGVIDSGNLAARWDATSGLGFQIQALTRGQGTVEGGFTAEDRALLTATDSRTQLLGELGDLVVQTASGPLTTTLANLFSRNSLDRLIFEEITSGPTCDPVRVVLAPIAQFAIAVRVTTVPEDIQFRTPDGEWSFPDLAVLRIFRGEDLQFRRGIHEVTFETEAPWEWGANFLNKNLLGIAPPQTQIMVDWRQGCCGQVFIRHMP